MQPSTGNAFTLPAQLKMSKGRPPARKLEKGYVYNQAGCPIKLDHKPFDQQVVVCKANSDLKMAHQQKIRLASI